MTEKVDFDLDARLAEAGDRTRTIKFAGRVWSLPSRYPTRAVQVSAQMRKVDTNTETGQEHALALFEAFVRALFGNATDDAIEAGVDDEVLGLILSEVYGVDQGESPASDSPS